MEPAISLSISKTFVKKFLMWFKTSLFTKYTYA